MTNLWQRGVVFCIVLHSDLNLAGCWEAVLICDIVEKTAFIILPFYDIVSLVRL